MAVVEVGRQPTIQLCFFCEDRPCIFPTDLILQFYNENANNINAWMAHLRLNFQKEHMNLVTTLRKEKRKGAQSA